MTQRKFQRPITPPRLVITTFVDILVTLALFYNFSQWGSYPTLQAKLLGVFACIYVLNDWMTTRASFVVYSVRVFVADILVIFIISNIPNALNSPNSIWGYSPFFWLAIGSVEFIYAFWDNVIKTLTPSKDAKKTLTAWTYLSFLSTALCVGVFIYQMVGKSILIGHLISLIPVSYLTIITVKWNWDRYTRAKAEGTSFLE